MARGDGEPKLELIGGEDFCFAIDRSPNPPWLFPAWSILPGSGVMMDSKAAAWLLDLEWKPERRWGLLKEAVSRKASSAP